MERSEISNIVKQDILFVGLNLEALGLEVDDLTDDKTLFDDLGIDSIDVLEIIAGIKRHFSIDLQNQTQDFYSTNFANIGAIIDLINNRINK